MKFSDLDPYQHLHYKYLSRIYKVYGTVFYIGISLTCITLPFVRAFANVYGSFHMHQALF